MKMMKKNLTLKRRRSVGEMRRKKPKRTRKDKKFLS